MNEKVVEKEIVTFKNRAGKDITFLVRKTLPKEKEPPVVLKSVYYNALRKKNKRIMKLLQIIKEYEAVFK